MTQASAFSLHGKVAIVAGGGSRSAGIGTGRASAILFARHGARVLVVDRNVGAAEETAAAISEEGGEAAAFEAELTASPACADMVEHAVARWGRLDILHNNVGIEGAGTVLDVDESRWDAVMGVNVKTVVLASRAAIPAMARGGGGAIVNTSSIAAFRPHGMTPYTTSKGAVIALTRAMALDHAGQGIRVNCIAPGPIYTPMVAGGMSDERRERRRDASPLRLEGTGWDVGYAALFLVSDQARYVTGVVLPVDGGVSVSSPDR
ncbi:MAG: SDR family oxidoreductase [Actinomycetota bacterium]|nr:SDR family oxidoreductase [Actinomycetota bacterium]